MSRSVSDRIIALAEPLAQKNGLEIVDVQYRKEGGSWYLRVFIDKEAGISLEDCERMSQLLDKLLDDTDPIPHGYILEVSSPGIERPLRKEDDYIRFRGRKVKVKTYAPIEGRRNFTGILDDYIEGQVIITSSGEEVSIPIEGIAQTRLVADF